jgi:hypothetical protein
MRETTNAEKILRQRQAHSLLGKFLDRAARDDLHPVAWTMAATGSGLAGEVVTFPYAQRRADFAVWRDVIVALAAKPPNHDSEIPMASGAISLRAQWPDVGPHGVRVTLSARILPGDADEDQN